MNLKELIHRFNETSEKIVGAIADGYYKFVSPQLERVGKKLDVFSNQQLALIIATSIMGIFLLTLVNIQLADKKEEEFLYELSFDEELLNEEIPQEEEMTLTELESHKAYNEAEESKFADELDDFKTLEELEQEAQEAASQNPDNTQDFNNDLSLNDGFSNEYAEKLKEQRRKIEALKRKGEAPKVNIKRRTTITYSLVDRSHYNLPNPVYTCESFGKVVINIVVDANGNVTDASFNASSSTTSNGCLVENATQYALKAKFTPKNGAEGQPGTITYLFQGE
ncbi:TonB family protein [Galbibacter mesophilus]|uniref:TonB family protein n=1 Tax=Galbibacter mesophilus TaxID=379069 RepID=UPI00191F94F9|nr:TonB family protein [Galbibacter mesophilus]MCM5662475.1 energy transducer TonB [Galbibacter mesophilus]